VTSEQRRRAAHSVLALRVARLFRLSDVARRLSRDGGTSGMRPPRALDSQKIGSNAAWSSLSKVS